MGRGVASRVFLVSLLATAEVRADPPAPPHRTLDSYRHFRALTIDLLGRAPRRDELAAFERADFDLNAWIDRLLQGPGYADRLLRVYMDVLRLEVGPAFFYAPPATTLRRQVVKGPGGQDIPIYYRQGQRRRRALTDGEFCLTQDESGLAFPIAGIPVGTARPIPQSVLDANTVIVRPWWLYRDFDDEQPSRWIPQVGDPDPLFQPVRELIQDPDGSATVFVRVCKEEAGAAETGTIFVADHPVLPPVIKDGKPTPAIPPGRFRPFPADDAYAKAHRSEPLSCRTSGALTMSVDCGCGVGLRHCLPGDSGANNPRAFVLPTRAPLGAALPLAAAPQAVSEWHKFWWSQEAQRFMTAIFAADRDLRELLTARASLMNGPLAEFYRSSAPASCCDREKAFGMVESAEPLVDPAVVPADLRPWDTRTWRLVGDRGPHAAGLLTMPAFLAKYASRRSRAAVLYTTFLCKSFVADKEELQPSKEPDLTIRPGCASCHATLEPLSAYFTRIEEGGWTFLPTWRFPLRNLACRKNAQGRLPGACTFFYDPDFSDESGGVLRGAYASVDHAAAGAVGAALAITQSPDFATCAVQRITSSFLGRALSSDDDELVKSLTASFRAAGGKPRALVRAIVRSDAYRQANNVRSALWRGEAPR